MTNVPTFIELLISKHMLTEPRRHSGYSISRSLRVSHYRVYRALHRMAEAGWLVVEIERANPSLGRQERKLYRFSDRGSARALQLLAQLQLK